MVVTAFSSTQMRIDGTVMPSAANKWIIEKPVVTPPPTAAATPSRRHLSAPLSEPEIDFVFACASDGKMNFSSDIQSRYLHIHSVTSRRRWRSTGGRRGEGLWEARLTMYFFVVLICEFFKAGETQSFRQPRSIISSSGGFH